MTENFASQRRKIGVLLALLTVYFSFNLTLRWLHYALFWGHGAYGWEQPTLLETAYQLFSVCLPFAAWALIAYVLACAMPRIIGLLTLTVVAFFVLLVIELDMNWYGFSRAHITTRDVQIFLTAPWKEHFGIQDYDVVRFSLKVAGHAFLLSLIYLVTVFASPRPVFDRLRRVRPWHFVIVVLTGVVIDGQVVGYHLNEGRRQWAALVQQQPMRLGIGDGLILRNASGKNDGLEAANRAWLELLSDNLQPALLTPQVGTGAAPWRVMAKRNAVSVGAPNCCTEDQERRTAMASHFEIGAANSEARPNIIIIAVEGLNQRLVSSETMPFLSGVTSGPGSWVVSENHYSTGNSTHYGILGLLFGAPPVFYKGEMREGLPVSKYIDLVTRRGYRSRQLSTDLFAHRNVGHYLANFTDPVLENNDHWELLEEASNILERPGSTFLFVYYGGTHYPYIHQPQYTHFEPETPEGFDFSRWNLSEYRDQIVNRYKNTLRETDDWLRTLLGGVDLDNTIVVITGDHGEEMFEQGRLSHSSSLGEPQIRTPLFAHIPGIKGRRLTAVTGHHDVMPTIVDALGWSVDFAQKGRSILQATGAGKAVIAYNNHSNPPKKWAVISGNRKSIFTGAAGQRLQVLGLYRRTDDTKLSYLDAPRDWKENLLEAVSLQLALDATTNRIQ